MKRLLTLLLNKWNYTSTDELETLNIDLTLLATEYPTYRIRIAGYFIIILSMAILSQSAESRSQLLQCVRCVVENIVIVSYTLHG